MSPRTLNGRRCWAGMDPLAMGRVPANILPGCRAISPLAQMLDGELDACWNQMHAATVVNVEDDGVVVGRDIDGDVIGFGPGIE